MYAHFSKAWKSLESKQLSAKEAPPVHITFPESVMVENIIIKRQGSTVSTYYIHQKVIVENIIPRDLHLIVCFQQSCNSNIH